MPLRSESGAPPRLLGELSEMVASELHGQQQELLRIQAQHGQVLEEQRRQWQEATEATAREQAASAAQQEQQRSEQEAKLAVISEELALTREQNESLAAKLLEQQRAQEHLRDEVRAWLFALPCARGCIGQAAARVRSQWRMARRQVASRSVFASATASARCFPRESPASSPGCRYAVGWSSDS